MVKMEIDGLLGQNRQQRLVELRARDARRPPKSRRDQNEKPCAMRRMSTTLNRHEQRFVGEAFA